MDPLRIRDDLVIPADELSISTARSSGPGGQHVNKTETRVSVSFALSRTAVLDEDARARLAALAPHLVTLEGDLVVTSQRFRSQRRNLGDCLDRLRQLVLEALKPPVPRRPTRPTRGSVERRRRDKEIQSRKKSQRQPPDWTEDE